MFNAVASSKIETESCQLHMLERSYLVKKVAYEFEVMQKKMIVHCDNQSSMHFANHLNFMSD